MSVSGLLKTIDVKNVPDRQINEQQGHSTRLDTTILTNISNSKVTLPVKL